jgi:hypothetical protein
MIMDYLSPRDILRLRRVCKMFDVNIRSLSSVQVRIFAQREPEGKTKIYRYDDNRLSHEFKYFYATNAAASTQAAKSFQRRLPHPDFFYWDSLVLNLWDEAQDFALRLYLKCLPEPRDGHGNPSWYKMFLTQPPPLAGVLSLAYKGKLDREVLDWTPIRVLKVNKIPTSASEGITLGQIAEMVQLNWSMYDESIGGRVEICLEESYLDIPSSICHPDVADMAFKGLISNHWGVLHDLRALPIE